MAINTVAKRFSALDVGMPWRGINAFPDGGGTLGDQDGNAIGDQSGNLIGDNTISPVNRYALEHLYSGFFAGNAYSITAESGSFAYTGNAATLTPATHINTVAERFSAINIGNVWRGLNVFPGSPAGVKRIVLANFYASFASTGAAYTLTAQAGSFAWVGEPSFSDFEVGANKGTFTLTGNAATLIATRTAYLSAGTFTMTGRDATLTKFTIRTLEAGTGIFTLTGSDATLIRQPRGMIAVAGTFSYVGGLFIATYTDMNGLPHEGGVRTLQATSGTFTMTGNAANFALNPQPYQDPDFIIKNPSNTHVVRAHSTRRVVGKGRGKYRVTKETEDVAT